MLTGKQRRFLRAMGSVLDPIVHIGKSGITEPLVKQVDDALEARELIKVRVLNNSSVDLKLAAESLTNLTGASLVQIIGHNFLLYRPSTKKPVIELPV